MRRHLTFANVMVVILTFIVLGGGAYAATQLPKNSVGAKQLKKGAVTKAKIQKKTLNELKGAVGATGPTGATGPAGPAGGTIAAGTTLRGVAVVGVLTNTPPGTTGALAGVDFGGGQFASRPSANIVPVGGLSTAACPGTVASPEAAPGNVCVYMNVTEPVDKGIIAISDPAANGANAVTYELSPKTTKTIGDGKVARFGFQITFIGGSESTIPQAVGSWAATAN